VVRQPILRFSWSHPDKLEAAPACGEEIVTISQLARFSSPFFRARPSTASKPDLVESVAGASGETVDIASSQSGVRKRKNSRLKIERFCGRRRDFRDTRVEVEDRVAPGTPELLVNC
jgi:hypothetical protein